MKILVPFSVVSYVEHENEIRSKKESTQYKYVYTTLHHWRDHAFHNWDHFSALHSSTIRTIIGQMSKIALNTSFIIFYILKWKFYFSFWVCKYIFSLKFGIRCWRRCLCSRIQTVWTKNCFHISPSKGI